MQLQKPSPGRFDAVGFGLNTTDVLAVVKGQPKLGTKQPVREMAVLPGGQTATAMTVLARLGWSARYVGRFGDDLNGRQGRISLDEAGVDTSACKIVPEASNALSLIMVEESSGERTVLWSRHPGLKLKPEDVSSEVVSSGRILLVDCHETAAATQAAYCAKKCRIPTVSDIEHVRPGIEELLKQIDIIITAQEFPSQFTGNDDLGAALKEIQETYRPALVCTTLGKDGSLARTSSGEIRTKGFRVSVEDTTGAGDVFRGGFIAGWLLMGNNASFGEVLRYANAAAALKCRSLGARQGIPNRDELDAILL